VLHSSRFTQRADDDDVDARTVERDYVLTHVMAGIAGQDGREHLVFKGGTALRLCFFDDYRYSADLDFSLTGGMTKSQAAEVIARAAERVAEDLGFPHLAINEGGDRIEYCGPLGGKLRTVKLDLAEDELVINTGEVALLRRYDDQPEGRVHAYTLEEVGAEKLRCVMQRMQARDLFDLHELFVERALDLDEIWPDFERKAEHKTQDPSRFAIAFEKRVPSWKRVWETEMETHVPADARPEFKDVERRVRRALRDRL
jgi:predicted nucleotidyltransferase component of viral defense system